MTSSSQSRRCQSLNQLSGNICSCETESPPPTRWFLRANERVEIGEMPFDWKQSSWLFTSAAEGINKELSIKRPDGS